MTDPAPDLLDIINQAPIGPDWDQYSAPALLDALTDEGFVVVRDRSGTLRHGDALVHVRAAHPHDDGWRRVERPEPVQPAKCETCGGSGKRPGCNILGQRVFVEPCLSCDGTGKKEPVK